MKIYLDTSILIVFLFGEEKEPDKFLSVSDLFSHINMGDLEAVISLYSFQEIHEYIKETFPNPLVKDTFRLSLLLLLINRIEILSLIPREISIYYKQRFFIRDRSDRPHVISALYNKSEAIIAYDDHFNDVNDLITYFTPEDFLKDIENKKH